MLYLPDYKAPKHKFRVIGVNILDGGDWIDGDFLSKEEAIECADKIRGRMLKAYVYDENGHHVYEGEVILNH